MRKVQDMLWFEPSDLRKAVHTGHFCVGDPLSKDVILIMGSCRAVNYLSYLHYYNETSGRPFSIYYIDPNSYSWRPDGTRVSSLDERQEAAEADTTVPPILKRVKIFIHEHYVRFGSFNTSSDGIYARGLQPEIDISVPNFYSRYILFQDILTYVDDIREAVRREGLTKELKQRMRECGVDAIQSFVTMCRKTSLPEFADYFLKHYKETRFFWSSHHVTGAYNLAMLRLMNRRFLKLPIKPWHFRRFESFDVFVDSKHNKPLTRQDIVAHGWKWKEPIKRLQLPH